MTALDLLVVLGDSHFDQPDRPVGIALYVLVRQFPRLTDERGGIVTSLATPCGLAIREAMEVVIGSNGVRLAHLPVLSPEVSGALAKCLPVRYGIHPVE
jgi:hypothetical protein